MEDVVEYFHAKYADSSSADLHDQIYWSKHSLSPQRMNNVLCFLYGFDPEYYAGIVDNGWLPESRASRCPAEYEQRNEGWWRLLEEHIRP